MKRCLVQVLVGCVGILLCVGSVSCAAKSAKSAATGEKNQQNMAPASQGKDEKGVPNVNVSVVQVNRQDDDQPAPKNGKSQKGGSAGDEAAAPDGASVEPVTMEDEPAGRLVQSQRVPTSYRIFQYMPDASKSLGTETLLSEMSKEIAGKIFYELKEEGERNFTAKVAVVSAVPLADFKRDTEFGRIVGEYLLTDLADRGLKVTELRMGKEINIMPQTGEFIMSRNIAEIANHAPELDYVVVTTFSNTRKTLIVQGRLVSLKDGQVKTSWRYGMPLNRELLGLFHSGEPPFRIAVKGIQQ